MAVSPCEMLVVGEGDGVGVDVEVDVAVGVSIVNGGSSSV